jgi:hypothetical protein
VGVTVSNFTEQECELVAELLRQRYRQPMSPELADSELQLDPASDQLTSCPTLFWSAQGANFVVCKTAAERYRCQFFYSDADHYGTGHTDYTDLRRCVLTLLRVQADHASQSKGLSSGATAAHLASGSDGGAEYDGPLVI